jgi:hypothetical protein
MSKSERMFYAALCVLTLFVVIFAPGYDEMEECFTDAECVQMCRDRGGVDCDNFLGD